MTTKSSNNDETKENDDNDPIVSVPTTKTITSSPISAPAAPSSSNTATITASSSFEIATTATSSSSSPFQNIIQQRHLQFKIHTPSSASTLHKSIPNFTDNTSTTSLLLSPDVEDTLFDAFIENDYEDALHLMTIIAKKEEEENEEEEETLGLVFWREVDSKEMEDWMDLDFLKESMLSSSTTAASSSSLSLSFLEQQPPGTCLLDGKEAHEEEEETKDVNDNVNTENDDDDDDTTIKNSKRNGSVVAEKDLLLVRGNSLKWLGKAAEDAFATSSSSTTLAKNNNIINEITHRWIKIELLAVHPNHFQKKIGTLLLAGTLYYASQVLQQEKSILHVAGGKENIPALKLYSKFGFVQAPVGLFQKPNKDLFVLCDIEGVLRTLDWSRVLPFSSSSTSSVDSSFGGTDAIMTSRNRLLVARDDKDCEIEKVIIGI